MNAQEHEIAVEVLVKHRSRGDSFCLAYDECKFRATYASVPKMRRQFAEHQVDEIEKALQSVGVLRVLTKDEKIAFRKNWDERVDDA